MNIRSLSMVLAALACVSAPVHGTDAANVVIVRLFAGNREVDLPADLPRQLDQKLAELLRSSNLHSGPGDTRHVFTLTGVQQDYRDTIADGRYLLLTMLPQQTVDTAGGKVDVAELVVDVGSHALGGKNTVFTIDQTGSIVSHAKYSGAIYLELLKTLGQYAEATDMLNYSTEPTASAGTSAAEHPPHQP
jgi:hypothetical protein